MLRKLSKLWILLLITTPCYGQLWSGVLDPARAITWSNAGYPGGLPDATWTQCGTTLASGSSATAVNSAIAACPASTFVGLAAGSYTWSAAINMKSGVVLRGMGTNPTDVLISFTVSGGSSCGGNGGDICFMGENTYYGSPWVQPGGTQAATWSGGYAQGATSITLTGVGSSGLSIGQYIYLDQANSAADNGNYFICDNTTAPCSLEGGSPGRTVGGIQRNQIQAVKITNISGSTYTITPGLYAPNWASGFTPGAWWPANQLVNSGVENVSMDHTSSGGQSGTVFYNAFNSWLSNVRDIAGGSRNHVWFVQAWHNSVTTSYLYGSPGGGPGHYGTETFIGGDNLVLNTIFQQLTAPMILGPSTGSVYAYNFTVGNISSPSDYMEPSIWSAHDAGPHYNLFEGNEGLATYADVFHGTSGFGTYLRNYFNCAASGITQNRSCVQIFAYNRYYNIVGNVLGTTGIQVTYSTNSGVGADGFIYNLNAGDTEGSVTVPSDSKVTSTMMRWGNYDVVNAAVQWNAGEVPSGISPYPNPVPSSHTIAPSFFYSTKPAFFTSAKPWPLTGPDVTSGNVSGVGGFANTTPAHDCYTAMGGPANGSGSVLPFTVANCPYLQQGSPLPPPPPPPVQMIALAVTKPSGVTLALSPADANGSTAGPDFSLPLIATNYTLGITVPVVPPPTVPNLIAFNFTCSKRLTVSYPRSSRGGKETVTDNENNSCTPKVSGTVISWSCTCN